MRHSVAMLSLLAGAACADDVLSFIFPGGFEGNAPVATILTAGPSTTSALLNCPSGTPSDECGFAAGLGVEIIGGTRYQASMSVESAYMSYGCDGLDTEAQTMTCTAELTGEDPVTAALSGTDVGFLTASVVKGAELLASATGSTSAGASPSGSASSASASISASASAAPKSSSIAASSGMQTSASPPRTAAGSASSTASSVPESTGAAARFGIEGAALLALAGAAAINAL